MVKRSQLGLSWDIKKTSKFKIFKSKKSKNNWFKHGNNLFFFQLKLRAHYFIYTGQDRKQLEMASYSELLSMGRILDFNNEGKLYAIY